MGRAPRAFSEGTRPGGGASSGAQRREDGEKAVRLDLEERLSVAEAGQAMSAEAAEADAGRQGPLHGGLGLAGDDDLATVGGPADPSRRVDGQSDVPGEIGRAHV